MKTWPVSVQLDNVKKTFGDKVALAIDSLRIEGGEVLGLVGNNGAGKTTMFRIILDLLKADLGETRIDNYITSECEDWKAFTGSYLDSGFLIEYLTPEEYFSFIAKVNGISKDELEERLKKFEDLMNGEVMGQNKLIRNLSAGNKQKVGIIAALLHNPQLIILDEPFNFLDPSSQLAIKYILDDYNKQTGATILISSHSLSNTLDICTRVILLEHGEVIKDMKKDEEDVTAVLKQYFESSLHHEQ
ncbi:MAG: ABC transporter ATP-binding protein [Bacteroidales bacterium]|nr:ABC transporter ATP-binding protein [Bacteroidales bacterium]MDO4823015.1 ABC transporter ATP-binding protein [Bacteroidales bacterium]